MKLNIQITLIVIYGVSLAGLLSGCAIHTKEDIARSTTEFNLVAEKAGNEMLFLNIIRASKRRPMYFTSIGKLTRNTTFAYGTGGVSIPFGRIGGGLDGSYSIAPSASFNDSPVLDVSVLDTKEFTNGIMTPVPMTTVEYYLSLGWPTEILMHLFIRSIYIRDPKDPNIILEEYVNYPGNRDEFECFQKLIRDYEWHIKKAVNVTKIGEVDTSETSKLQNLIEVQNAGLTLKEGKENNKMELCSSQTKYILKGEKNGKILEIDESDIFMRSPHGMLYYLGEITRVEMQGENKGEKDPNLKVPMIRAGYGKYEGMTSWLFYAREEMDEDIKPCVSVNYEGIRYVIPGAPENEKGYCTDRSMQVLALVSQLIGLQKKSEEAPTTSTVKLIGQ